LSKRKISALRTTTQDPRFSSKKTNQTFYMKESKTIDFSQAQKYVRVNKSPLELVPESLNQEKYIIALLDETPI
jgi:hypothetical protein